MPHEPRLAQLGERAQRLLERHVVVGPVQQQEVDVVDLQPLERPLGRRAHAVGGELVAPQLRRQEELVARHTAGGEPLADLGFVLICLRGVDVPVADFERIGDRLLAVAAEDLPGPESELGDGGTLDLEGAQARHRSWSSRPPTPAARLLPSGPIPGRLAQLGERRLDKAEVTGSSPVSPIFGALQMRGFWLSRVPMGSRSKAGGERTQESQDEGGEAIPGRRAGDVTPEMIERVLRELTEIVRARLPEHF